MSDAGSQFNSSASTAPPATPASGRFSMERLSSAFARLMGVTSLAAATEKPQIALESEDDATTLADDAQVTPRMIVEGMLFVGSLDGQPIAARDIAAHIRDVDAAEVDAIVAELNAAYASDEAAYEIASAGGGYRLQLRGELAAVRQRFRGRIRTARLSPATLEVLAVVAYQQGSTGDQVNRQRGSRSDAILAQLVRRQLIRVDRPNEAPRTPHYYTTERFNQLFGVHSPADLPRAEDLDDR